MYTHAHHVIQDYRNKNPQSHLNTNICAFQGRVGPTKGGRVGGVAGPHHRWAGTRVQAPPLTDTYSSGLATEVVHAGLS